LEGSYIALSLAEDKGVELRLWNCTMQLETASDGT